MAGIGQAELGERASQLAWRRFSAKGGVGTPWLCLLRFERDGARAGHIPEGRIHHPDLNHNPGPSGAVILGKDAGQ